MIPAVPSKARWARIFSGVPERKPLRMQGACARRAGFGCCCPTGRATPRHKSTLSRRRILRSEAQLDNDPAAHRMPVLLARRKLRPPRAIECSLLKVARRLCIYDASVMDCPRLIDRQEQSNGPAHAFGLGKGGAW